MDQSESFSTFDCDDEQIIQSKRTKRSEKQAVMKKSIPSASPPQTIPRSPFFTTLKDKNIMMNNSIEMNKDPTYPSTPNFNSSGLPFVNTPPDTPTFQAYAKSHPLSIPSLPNPMPSFLMTPPATPTSPFESLSKHVFPPKMPLAALEVSFDTSSTFSSDSPSSDSFAIQEEADVTCKNEKDAIDVTLLETSAGKPPEGLNKSGQKRKYRPELRLNTKMRCLSLDSSQQFHDEAMFQKDATCQDDIGENVINGGKFEGLKINEDKYEDLEIDEGWDEEVQSDQITMEGSSKDMENLNNVKSMVLCFIGSDLRKVADQFQTTYAKVDRFLRDGRLNLTVSTSITGCLSVSVFCLRVGEDPPMEQNSDN